MNSWNTVTVSVINVLMASGYPLTEDGQSGILQGRWLDLHTERRGLTMSKRNDMITRMVNVYKLRLRFFDTESRQQQETFTERYSRRDEMDMIRDEFARWKNVKPYVLTGVDVLSKERVLYGMTPENFYKTADVLTRVDITEE